MRHSGSSVRARPENSGHAAEVAYFKLEGLLVGKNRFEAPGQSNASARFSRAAGKTPIASVSRSQSSQ